MSTSQFLQIALSFSISRAFELDRLSRYRRVPKHYTTTSVSFCAVSFLYLTNSLNSQAIAQ